jgi:hypothetical protein
MSLVNFQYFTRKFEAGEVFIDIGSGASRLVDHLIANGLGPLTVLDLSSKPWQLAENV